MYRLVFRIFVVSIIIAIYGRTFSSDEDDYLIAYPYTFKSIPFDWNIFKELAVEKKNFIVSPTCLKIVLALVYQGSQATTKYEYENVFELADKKHISNQYQDILGKLISAGLDNQVHVGSRIFLLSDIVPEQKFAKIAKDVFQTDIEPIDFSGNGSKKIVNDWVEKLTNSKMKQLIEIDDINDMSILIANIAYFKGTWRYQFSTNHTFLGKFDLIKDHDVVLLFRTVTVPYMTIEESFYYYEDFDLKVKIVRLPYKGGPGHFAMFIILPTSNESLQTVLEKISEGDVARLLRILYGKGKKRVRVTLPRFRINSEKRLASTLQKFGMYRTFRQYQIPLPIPTAIEPNISSIRKFDVIQKVGIEVDETGEKLTTGNKPEEVEAVFEVTRSFLFFVADFSGYKLIVGKVENPLQ